MTVINMVSVQDGGVAVADEQSSNRIRKMNTSDKLHSIKLGEDRYAIYGGSGPAFSLNQLYLDSQEAIQQREDISVREAAETTRNIVTSFKQREKDSILRATIGIGLEDMIAGTFNGGRPISNDTSQTAKNILQEVDQKTNISILFGGMGPNGFEIYHIDSFGDAERASIPYSSIGSGSDESQKVLNQYVAKMTREDRRRIDPKEGIVKAIEATNAAADINVGVGGSPSIMYMRNNELNVPSENQCIAASEVVRGLTGGFLEEKFAYDSVFSLVTKREGYEEIARDMMENSNDPEGLNMFLRGYKKER